MAAAILNKIQIKNLKKAFGHKQVLNGLSLDVKRGESLVILGGSGTGKSVLLRCLLGLVQPDSGEITIDGQPITMLTEKDRYQIMRKFGMLFQAGALFDSLSVWENVAFGLLQQNKPAKEAKKVAIEKLAAVGLAADVADMAPSQLSGGMRKRVALARAICLEPEIILYDEPTTGLDPITSDVINELILKLKKTLGATSITITHDMKSAFKVADRIALLHQGNIIFQGSVAEVQSTTNPYVVQFINGFADGPMRPAV